MAKQEKALPAAPCQRVLSGCRRIDCCVPANNQVLDWGYVGRVDFLQTLHRKSIETAGAGRIAGESAAPAVIKVGGSARATVHAFCTRDSGVPAEWEADETPQPQLTRVTYRSHVCIAS